MSSPREGDAAAGTELGLAIARWMVEAHADTIELAGRATGGKSATIGPPDRSR